MSFPLLIPFRRQDLENLYPRMKRIVAGPRIKLKYLRRLTAPAFIRRADRSRANWLPTTWASDVIPSCKSSSGAFTKVVDSRRSHSHRPGLPGLGRAVVSSSNPARIAENSARRSQTKVSGFEGVPAASTIPMLNIARIAARRAR